MHSQHVSDGHAEPFRHVNPKWSTNSACAAVFQLTQTVFLVTSVPKCVLDPQLIYLQTVHPVREPVFHISVQLAALINKHEEGFPS